MLPLITEPPHALVLQTMFRSGGTFFWAALRDAPHVRAYGEPLHESLADAGEREWNRLHESGGAEALRHPNTSRHYFAEYPFVDDRVVGHHRRFSFARFCLTREDQDPELAAYLLGLVAYAGQRGQRAAFKFVRGCQRADWLRRQVPGTHAYLNRDPKSILASYLSFGGLRSYFVAAHLIILQLNAGAPEFRHVVEDLRIPVNGPDLRRPLDTGAASDLAAQLGVEAVSDVIYFFWGLNLLTAGGVADRIVDYDRVVTEQVYREEIDSWLTGVSGSQIHLQQNAPEVRDAPAISDRPAAWLKSAKAALRLEFPSMSTLSSRSGEAFVRLTSG